MFSLGEGRVEKLDRDTAGVVDREYVRVVFDLTESDVFEFLASENWELSTRSVLTENGTELAVPLEPEFTVRQIGEEYRLEAWMEKRDFHNASRLRPGDGVVELVVYEDVDRIVGRELEQLAEEYLDSAVDGGRVRVPACRKFMAQNVSHARTLGEIEGEPEKYLLNQGFSCGGELDGFTLFRTGEVQLPDDVYGVVRGVDVDYVHLLNSTVIPPGYEGRLDIPLAKMGEPRGNIHINLELELYRATYT